jgi:hypothetical protein
MIVAFCQNHPACLSRYLDLHTTGPADLIMVSTSSGLICAFGIVTTIRLHFSVFHDSPLIRIRLRQSVTPPAQGA